MLPEDVPERVGPEWVRELYPIMQARSAGQLTAEAYDAARYEVAARHDPRVGPNNRGLPPDTRILQLWDMMARRRQLLRELHAA